MLIRPLREDDLPAVLDIYNDAVLNTTAVWNEEPVDLSNRLGWLREKQAAHLPVLACVFDDRLAGYATFGPFRPWSGYRQTVEHSVYVAANLRRRGTGRLLLESLIVAARDRGMHVIIAGIEGSNAASIALHENVGFADCGTLKQVGTKFGRWLDLVFMQLVLDPSQGIEA